VRPLPDDPQAAFELGMRRGRRGCLVAAVTTAVLVGLLYAAYRWYVRESVGPVAQGEGWVAFLRTVDVGIDRDTYVYLARSVRDRSSRVRLAPIDTVVAARFEWVGPKHLRIAAWPRPPRRGKTRVEDVTIEWTQY
jgi:hypothetical protein